MSTLTFQHVSFEGKRTTRLPPPTARGKWSHWADGDSPPSTVPGAELAWRTLVCCGIDADAYRSRPLLRRLPACLRALDARTEDEARPLLDTRADARGRALDTLLISVTGFFRDPAVFSQLERNVLPILAGRVGPPRVWSAGCANGAELYSMGILLAEAGLLARSELLGTDCRAAAITEARTATFGSTAIVGLSAHRLARFFEPFAPGRWRPVEAVRARAEWRLGDIARDTAPGPWDVILWRNVAIYMRAEPARAIARRLADTLAPGGFIVIGKAERLPPGLGLRRIGPCLYQRTGCTHGA